jgi:Zn-dependent peptidase ImmA (M78 family)
MHCSPGTGSEQEKEADAFAAEFLMPASDIRPAFTHGIDLARLADLKREWKVSMNALLRRALTLNAITEWQYRSVTVEMSALGYRTAEPIDIPAEVPRRVPELIKAARRRALSTEDLAAAVRLLPEDFAALYEHPAPQPPDSSSKARS